ncbi:MAG: hypothetical protein HUK24_07250 [Sphaerochaetaceae bacterium]|nr:hypothetical protein [Sphaerochaetaceae bacterium]
MIILYTIIVLLFSPLVVSCQGQVSVSNNDIVVATWNVQNLFDDIDSGNEYSEYTSSGGWNTKAYESRIKDICSVFSYGELREAKVIILNEVESDKVVQDLLSQNSLKTRGFCYYALGKNEGNSIGTAIISTFPIQEPKIHSVGEPSYNLRPVLEVKIVTEFGDIFILAVHGKSNLEGKEETAKYRLEMGKTLKVISKNLLIENPSAIILICGDFNEEYLDDNVMIRSGNLSKDGSFTVTGNKTEAGTLNMWYCFWMDKNLELYPRGSYCYNGVWESYDNILVSNTAFDKTALELCDTGGGVIFQGILKKLDGTVNSWNRTMLSGVSDHLPVWIRLAPV